MRAPVKLGDKPLIFLANTTISTGTVSANTPMANTAWHDFASEYPDYVPIGIASFGFQGTAGNSFVILSFSVQGTQVGARCRNVTSSNASGTVTVKAIMLRKDYYGT